MDYRIEAWEQFRLVGYKERMSMEQGQSFIRIPQFWNELTSNGKCQAMMKYNDNKRLCCLGVCAYGDEKSFDYYIATGSNQAIPQEMAELIVPTSTYAIFTCTGKLPQAQQDMWKRIFSEWFPASGYAPTEGPQIEWYAEGDMNAEDYHSEIWIPVQKKN